MNNITIRKAEKSDALNLSVLKKQVFISTYALNGINAEFSNHITKTFVIEEILKSIEDDRKIILLAERANSLIGCAELFLDSICKETKSNSPELNVLYVFEHAKNRGVGFSLITESERIIKGLGFPGLWLTVYYKNINAIKFYLRQSYNDIGTYHFEMEGKKYENRIMFKQF